jgi:hypothetical protein
MSQAKVLAVSTIASFAILLSTTVATAQRAD